MPQPHPEVKRSLGVFGYMGLTEYNREQGCAREQAISAIVCA